LKEIWAKFGAVKKEVLLSTLAASIPVFAVKHAKATVFITTLSIALLHRQRQLSGPIIGRLILKWVR